MRLSAAFLLVPLSLGLALLASATVATTKCSRQCLTDMVTQVIDSMVAHDPYSLPFGHLIQSNCQLAPGSIDLLALDVTKGTAYFALDVSEGNRHNETILRGRIAVVDQKISEVELFIDRYRGDYGFSFNATQLPTNYATLMSPPANRTNPTREDLMTLSAALFAPYNSTYNSSSTCQSTEIGWRVIDRGNYDNGTTDPISCGWPVQHPTDPIARVGLVVDEELGFVVTSGIIQGKVYHYEGRVGVHFE